MSIRFLLPSAGPGVQDALSHGAQNAGPEALAHDKVSQTALKVASARFAAINQAFGIPSVSVNAVVRARKSHTMKDLERRGSLCKLHSASLEEAKDKMRTRRLAPSVVGGHALAMIEQVSDPAKKQELAALVPETKTHSALAMVLGTHVVVDARLRDFLAETDLSGALFIRPGVTQWRHFARYTTPLMCALDAHAHGMQRLMDVGSAEGILSVRALQAGVRHVTALEIEPSFQDQFTRMLNANGLDATPHRFLNGDITESHFFDAALEAATPDAVISNIGPHYGDAQDALLRQVTQRPNIRTAIFGGYIWNSKHHAADQVIAQMLQAGFHLADNFVNVDPFCRDLYSGLVFVRNG